MNKNLFIIPLISLSVFLPVSKVSAEELVLNSANNAGTGSVSSGLKSASEQINASSDSLVNLKDSGASSPIDEFAARKKVVADALNLANKEIIDLRTNLNELPEFSEDSREAELLSQYASALHEYLKYYSKKTNELEAVKEVDEIKQLAKEIIDFRTNIYNPMIDEIADFNLLFYTADTIGTASIRLTKINTDIKRLEKLNFIKPGLFKAKLDKSSETLRDATLSFMRAQSLILSPADAVTVKSEVKARELLETSLGSVKETYEIFLQVSKDVRKALGLR